MALIVLRLAHYLQNLGRKALLCSLSKMGVHPINRVRFDFPRNRRRHRCR
nr:MAG TPA: hypothetical protein [Caudoviricetes sp.]